MAKCAADRVYWINTYCWTYDPRLLNVPIETGEEDERFGAYLRFHPWPKQEKFLQWLGARFSAQDSGACEKSRDQGATYLVMAFFLHAWLFQPGFKGTCTSYEQDKVESLEDPDSMFEKLRIMLRRLPTWMMPEGFSWVQHSLAARLINPSNGSIITGEWGKNVGRGGRSSVYAVDEADFLAHPQQVEAALSGTADCVIWMSTFNPGGGPGSFFVRKLQSMPAERRAVLDWRDDPRKDELWAAEKKASLTDPLIWEFEYERNYQASAEGICVPAKWVQAALRLRDLEPGLKFGRRRIAGLDVGAGKAKSVYIDRAGPIVGRPMSRDNPNTTGTALWALGLAVERHAEVVNYDALGPGVGVTSTFASETRPGIQIIPINNGDPAGDRVWDDGRTAAETFANRRAEAWWTMRCAFERTYEHVCYLEGAEGGVRHPLDELISLPNHVSVEPLVTELSGPKWLHNTRNKILIESKEDMQKRGLRSPDHADALANTFLEPVDEEAHGIFKRHWFRLWPNGMKLPEFSYIVMSVRTAFDDERRPKGWRGVDPVCCGIYGVFNLKQAFKDEKQRKGLGVGERQYAALLCDYWSEPIGFGEALERIRDASRTKYGAPGHRPNVVIVEEDGLGDLSLRHALGEYKVPALPFATEQSRTTRAHEASVLVEQGGLFMPESGREDRKGRVRDWAEPLLHQLCSFTGKTGDGGVDQLSAALVHLMLRDTLKAAPRRNAYPDPDEKTEAEERDAVLQHEREKRGGYSPYGS